MFRYLLTWLLASSLTHSLTHAGGFYVRSLISDLGRACNTRAHMTGLLRTKQGVFQLNDCLYKEEWYAPYSLTHSFTHSLIELFREYEKIVSHIEKYKFI